MKRKTLFVFFLLLLIVLLSAFVLFEHQKQVARVGQINELRPLAETKSPASQVLSSISSNAFAHTGKIISNVTTSSNRIVVGEKDGVQKTAYIPLTMASALTDAQILETLFHTNSPPKKSKVRLNQHLTFFGVAVDDQTNALAGVTVKGSILVMDSQNPGHQVSVEATSDAEGRFQFDMDYGQTITLNVSKGTNYISPPMQSFRYPPGWYGSADSELISNPDAANPIIFTLTKKKNPEPLIEIRTGMGAPNTGEPVRIDVTTGKVVPTGGDLIVSITCPEPFKAGVHIPWKLVLTATDGGLVTIRDGQFGYLLNNCLEAPISGYDEIVIDHPRDDPNWDTQYDSILYLKSRNGQIYGKLSFDMHVGWDERGVPFGFHSFVNTNASRNLQGISQ